MIPCSLFPHQQLADAVYHLGGDTNLTLDLTLNNLPADIIQLFIRIGENRPRLTFSL